MIQLYTGRERSERFNQLKFLTSPFHSVSIDQNSKKGDMNPVHPNCSCKFVSLGEVFENASTRDFPGGPVVKNPPANAGDAGSIPGPGRSHMPRGN